MGQLSNVEDMDYHTRNRRLINSQLCGVEAVEIITVDKVRLRHKVIQPEKTYFSGYCWLKSLFSFS
jgi:hypothetical protein